MSDAVTITSLELDNVKRVKAVRMSPAATGLTVIGGDNRQGKTSILDGIAYALGGERRRPTNLQREGAAADARIELTMSNGLRVERKGKNAALKVTDPTGNKSGQRLLDAFVEELALDLPKFLRMTGKEKAGVLLRILGIEDQLAALEREERTAYDERTTQGRVAESKQHHAEQMPEHHDCPETPESAAGLVAAAQAVMARNAERQSARNNLDKLWQALDRARTEKANQEKRVQQLKEELARATSLVQSYALECGNLERSFNEAQEKPVSDDESTADIERRMADLEVTNAKVRANLDKRKAVEDAAVATHEYEKLTAKVDAVRARRLSLLNGAEMPLAGLSVDGGELTYHGKAWDCMASAEQVRAGVAIVRKLRPECGFVLLDGLECLDVAELGSLDAWLQANSLQAIATRVSRGEECTIVIEDGLVAGQADEPETTQPQAAAPDSGALADW